MKRPYEPVIVKTFWNKHTEEELNAMTDEEVMQLIDSHVERFMDSWQKGIKVKTFQILPKAQLLMLETKEQMQGKHQ